jgi:glutathione peroxidase
MSKLIAGLGVGLFAAFVSQSAGASDVDFKVKTLAGKEVDLAKQYQGKVLLVVNVASKCGLTPQYKDLQALADKYKDQGFCVLGFPCNQFGEQEPGTPDEIREFCTQKYNVTFDLFEKIQVNGDGACALYKHLTSLDAKPKGAGAVSWNFEKFLVGRDGKVAARHQPRTKPTDELLIADIERELAKK